MFSLERGMIAGEYTKKCLYCGRINSASALACAGCGASEFELLPPTYFPPAPTGRRFPLTYLHPIPRLCSYRPLLDFSTSSL